MTRHKRDTDNAEARACQAEATVRSQRQQISEQAQRIADLEARLEADTIFKSGHGLECQGSRAEVVTRRDAIPCHECGESVAVLEYRHPRHGTCHMLAPHPLKHAVEPSVVPNLRFFVQHGCWNQNRNNPNVWTLFVSVDGRPGDTGESLCRDLQATLDARALDLDLVLDAAISLGERRAWSGPDVVCGYCSAGCPEDGTIEHSPRCGVGIAKRMRVDLFKQEWADGLAGRDVEPTCSHEHEGKRCDKPPGHHDEHGAWVDYGGEERREEWHDNAAGEPKEFMFGACSVCKIETGVALRRMCGRCEGLAVTGAEAGGLFEGIAAVAASSVQGAPDPLERRFEEGRQVGQSEGFETGRAYGLSIDASKAIETRAAITRFAWSRWQTHCSPAGPLPTGEVAMVTSIAKLVGLDLLGPAPAPKGPVPADPKWCESERDGERCLHNRDHQGRRISLDGATWTTETAPKGGTPEPDLSDDACPCCEEEVDERTNLCPDCDLDVCDACWLGERCRGCTHDDTSEPPAAPLPEPDDLWEQYAVEPREGGWVVLHDGDGEDFDVVHPTEEAATAAAIRAYHEWHGTAPAAAAPRPDIIEEPRLTTLRTRRAALHEGLVAGTLTPDEDAELTAIDKVHDRHIAAVDPLPLDEVRRVEAAFLAARRKPAAAPQGADAEDRSEPPPGWCWEVGANDFRTGYVHPSEGVRTLEDAWALHDQAMGAAHSAPEGGPDDTSDAQCWRMVTAAAAKGTPEGNAEALRILGLDLPAASTPHGERPEPGDRYTEGYRAAAAACPYPTPCAKHHARASSKHAYVPKEGDQVEWTYQGTIDRFENEGRQALVRPLSVGVGSLVWVDELRPVRPASDEPGETGP